MSEFWFESPHFSFIDLAPNHINRHLEALYIVAKDLNSSFLSAVVQAESTFVQLVNVIHKFTFKILFLSLIIQSKIISGSIFLNIFVRKMKF